MSQRDVLHDLVDALPADAVEDATEYLRFLLSTDELPDLAPVAAEG